REHVADHRAKAAHVVAQEGVGFRELELFAQGSRRVVVVAGVSWHPPKATRSAPAPPSRWRWQGGRASARRSDARFLRERGGHPLPHHRLMPLLGGERLR